MPNVILTSNILTKAVLMNLGDGRMSVCRNMSHDYSKEFGRKGQKIGSKLSVRKPQRFAVVESMAYAPQPLTNTFTPIVVDQWAQVPFEFDSEERTLAIDEVQEMYAKPAAIAISTNVNQRAAKYVAQHTANAVGTPGATPTTVAVYLQPMDRLVEIGLPEGEEDNVTMIINRRMSSAFLAAQTPVFHAGGSIDKEYADGDITNRKLGYKWAKDQTLHSSSFGTYTAAGVVDGANQSADGGDNASGTLVTKSWTACALKANDRFTVAGVFSVHPQTKQSTGSLKVFLLEQDAASATAPTLNIYPAITPGGQHQNVSASPADGAAITVLGTTGVAHTQAIALHRDAFAFLSVPLENPEKNGVEMVSQQSDPKTGLNLSFVRVFDGYRREHVTRFDSLFGFGGLYRELACVLYAGL